MASALIKSIRGSDPDAALYWMARMLKGGEDPLFIARRLIISAAEDVGNANPHALPLAVAAAQAVQMIGLPEGRIPLAQAITYLAASPKSNASYLAINKAARLVEEEDNHPVPDHLKSTAYKGAARMGHGKGYKYPHDFPGHYIEQEYLPPALKNKKLYEPTEEGTEIKIKKSLEQLRKRNENKL
jgi:putative ATPase